MLRRVEQVTLAPRRGYSRSGYRMDGLPDEDEFVFHGLFFRSLANIVKTHALCSPPLAPVVGCVKVIDPLPARHLLATISEFSLALFVCSFFPLLGLPWFLGPWGINWTTIFRMYVHSKLVTHSVHYTHRESRDSFDSYNFKQFKR